MINKVQGVCCLIERSTLQPVKEALKWTIAPLPDSVQVDLMNRIVQIDRLPNEVLEKIDALLKSLLHRR